MKVKCLTPWAPECRKLPFPAACVENPFLMPDLCVTDVTSDVADHTVVGTILES
jgi:hypothetical protein